MKKIILSMILTIVLILSFSLVTAAPTVATDGGTFNNPDYFYKRLLDTGANGPRWPDYNAIAGKICWYESGYDGYFADYDAATLELSNVTQLAPGEDVYITTFSKDGQYIYYQDVADAHMTSLVVAGGTIKAYPAYRYNIAADTHELIFDISTITPATIEALTTYVGNEFGFYLGPGGSNNEVLMCVRDGHGQMDIVSYNITEKTFVNLSNSEQAEYDGRYFGTDTSQLLYWTESYPTHADRSVAILSGVVETVIDTKTAPDMYLTARWGEDQNHVMAMQGTGWSSNDLVMFTKDGDVWSGPEDLTGDAWSATDGGLNVGAWVGNGFIFSVRNSAGNSANGLWVAMLPADEVWVDDDWTGLSPGDPVDGHTFGYDAFATIQDGIDAVAGSTVYVAPGHYVEAITITNPVTVLGATCGVNKNGYTVPAGYAWDDSVESIITHPNPSGGYDAIVDIYDTDDVTFDGFVVQELYAEGNKNTSLIRVRAQTQEVSNVIVNNNVIGPNTNGTSQDGAQGRMGLYLVNNPYSDLYGIVNSTFAGNKIFDCKGNGDNVFLWSSYYAYGANGPASMSGTVIEDNEIYGAHRSGIETAGGYSGLTVRNNKIYGNSGLPGDEPNFLKYGNGILLIRGSGDKLGGATTAYGPENLTIMDNEIYGNEKNGIYMGPINKNYTITGNEIYDNGWDGIMLDLEGQYWNPTFEPEPDPPNENHCYDGSEDITAQYNNIYGNDQYGIRVVGTPTNGFVFSAEKNWWGHASGPSGPDGRVNNKGKVIGKGDAILGNVDWDPYLPQPVGHTPHHPVPPGWLFK